MDATYPLTEAERRKQGIEAQDAYEEAGKALAGLIFQLKKIGKRHSHIAAVIGAIELAPNDPLQSESHLLMLPANEFEGIGHDAIRQLTNAIVSARREVAEARILAQSLGRNV